MSDRGNEILSDPVEHKFNYESAKIAFNQELGNMLREKRLLNKVVHQNSDIDMIILDIELNKEYFSEACEIVKENGKSILGEVCRIKRKIENLKKTVKGAIVKQFISLDELFDVMSELHIQEPSLKEEEVLSRLSNCVLPMPFVSLFRKSCETCNASTKSLDEQYQIVGEMNIIKLDSPDGQFTDVFVYVDRNTNFVLLRPLQSLSDNELAYELAIIFAEFPKPSCIYSKNIRSTFAEYNKIFKILNSTWPPFKVPVMFPSKTAHKIIPITNQARKMLIDWMEETGSTNWGIGAHVVQWQMNTNNFINTYIRSRVLCGPILCPYHSMFGLLPRTHLVTFKKKHQSDSTWRNEKVLVNCSQCHQPVYKVFKCYFCKQHCHFTCCIRFVELAFLLPNAFHVSIQIQVVEKLLNE